MFRWLFLLTLGALGALILRSFLFEGIVIATASMEPTLPVGHHAFVNKFIYRVKAPGRGDVVVFPSPIEAKEMVKRVIAVPGDTVAVKNKTVILNGKEITEGHIQHTRPNEILRGDNIEPLSVPKGHVFVMGDNRDESGDSRDWINPRTGEHIYFVPIRRIKGRVLGVK